MAQYRSQLQNQFLSDVRKRRQAVEIVLETGNVLKGRVKSYDRFSVTLVYKGQTEVVYKSAIIYIAYNRRRQFDSYPSRRRDGERPQIDFRRFSPRNSDRDF